MLCPYVLHVERVSAAHIVKCRQGGGDAVADRSAQQSATCAAPDCGLASQYRFRPVEHPGPSKEAAEMLERTVSERPIDQGHPSMIGTSVIVSPDCRRVAYVPRMGKKELVVVDGQEGK